MNPAPGIIAPHPAEHAQIADLAAARQVVCAFRPAGYRPIPFNALAIPITQLLPSGQGTPPPEARGEGTGTSADHAQPSTIGGV